MEYTTARLYRLRFEKDIKIRNEIWKVLCQDFFQKYIKTTDTICDLGAGFCEFINNIKAQNKIAIDVNPESRKYAASDVQVVACKSVNLAQKIKDKLDLTRTDIRDLVDLIDKNFVKKIKSNNYTDTEIIKKRIDSWDNEIIKTKD